MYYLTDKELKKMVLQSWKRIEKEKEKINKINVFPVPDMDTGSNLARTLEGVKKAIENREFKDLDKLSEVILDEAMIAAQGNVGVIYTGFLAGFLPILDKNPIDAKKLARAMVEGAKRARASIQNPTEGTILDVIDAATESIKKNSERENNILNLFKKAIAKANDALLATRDKIEVLKKANVVDAGGLGFLMILESHLEALEGEKREREERPSEKVRRFVQTISYRYEVIFLIKNLKIKIDDLKERLKKLGNSLEVLQIKDKIKVHIHTDEPDEVREIAKNSGQILDFRIEDMAKEISGEESVKKVSIGIVVEDIADLPEKILEKYQIEKVPAILDWPEVVNLPGENIYQKMKEAERRGIKELGRTSQPIPKAYLEAYKKQLQKFEKILCITITSKISGAYNSACQARSALNDSSRVYVLDSLSATAGQALLVLKAIELIQEQKEIGEIIGELKNLIPKIHLYLFFEDPRWIEATGRITPSQANWIRRMKKVGIRPLLEFKNGLITKGGFSVFAKDTAEALFRKIEKDSRKIRKKGKKIRVIIVHADNSEGAEKLKKMLKEKIKAEVPFINLVCTLIGSRFGPGGLIAAWHEIM
ncbi:DegV family EDD domain-containing protein [Patescibacteria group bacterium]|nr:DegV family EDD domain-containing protein [Patescibacteria group bacterium]